MAQHRMAAILLFVVLSFCCSAVEFHLEPDGGHCKISHHCQTGCCYRYSRNADGKCVHPCLHHPCYGPVNGDGCFHSQECFSGCCHTDDLVKQAKCVPEDSGLKCFGQGHGDLCAESAKCKSGCCVTQSLKWASAGTCQLKAEEGQHCTILDFNHRYEFYCPCAPGLICEQSGGYKRKCKKPNSK